jgi:lipopolysaccharide exporter
MILKNSEYQLKLTNRIKKLFIKESFLARIIILAGGTAVGQMFSILSMPLITRLYLPEDLGRYGLFTSFIAIGSVSSSLLYEPAIVSAKDDREAADLTILCFFLILMTAPLVTLLFWIMVRSNILGFGSFTGITAIWVVICYVFVAIFNTLKYWFIRKGNFPLLGSISAIQNIARSLIQILAGLAFTGSIGLLAGDAIGRGCGISRMLNQGKEGLIESKSPIQISRLYKISLTYIKYPKYVLPSSIIDVLASTISMPIIMTLYGGTSGGQFVLAQRLLSIPIGLISVSTADAFHNQISTYATESIEKIRPFFLKTAYKLFLTSCIISIPMAAMGLSGLNFFFGADWANAGLLVLLMLPWSMLGLVVSPLSRITFVLNSQQYKLIYDVFSLLGQILVFIYAAVVKPSLFETTAWLSIVGVLAYAIYFHILLKIVNLDSFKSDQPM